MSTKPKIIYIDDEEINVTLMKLNLADKYEVLTGLSGYDGLKLLEENPEVKTVISDMKMPQMNGLEFIRLAKQTYSNKRYYILTGFDINNDITEAINSGMIVKYFRKPFNMDEIKLEIKNKTD